MQLPSLIVEFVDFVIVCTLPREVARPFLKGMEPFKRVKEPFTQGLETAFIPSKTTKHPTIIAFLMEYCVTIDANR